MALDRSFELSRRQVEDHLSEFPRHTQVRISKWLQKLSQPVTNLTFKRERNAYIALLLFRIQQANKHISTASEKSQKDLLFAEPFDKLPRDEPLPKLPNHLRSSKINPNPNPRNMSRMGETPPFAEVRVTNRTVSSSPRRSAPSGPNYVVLYQEAQAKLQKQEETIARLEQELENERRIRERDRKRLCQLHQSEVEELKTLHETELARLRTSAGNGLLMQRTTPSKEHGSTMDDESFLRYAEEFQARSESILKRAN